MSDQEYGEDYENEEQHNEEENEDKNENLEQSNKNESQANNNEDENNEQQQNDNDGDDENQDNNEQDQQQDDQKNEEENQDNEGEKEEDQQEEKMEKSQQKEEEQEQEVEESQFEQSMQSEQNVNLESIDAVSVKISKEEKGTQKKGTKKATKTATKTSSQQEMVNQLMKKHKEKQQKMQKREDEIYVQEKIEKKQPKPQIKPKVITKQKLTFDKQTKAQLEDPQLNNQQKAAILTKDLGKKLDVQVVVKEVPKKIEVKKPGKGSEAKPKKNLFDVRVGAGIKSKLEIEADDKSQRDKEKERNAFLDQKKREKEQAIKFQQEQDELLKIKQNNIKKAQEKALERDNKVLQVNTEKQQEIKQVYEAKRKELIKEKEEDNKDQIKKDLDILRALRKENTLLTDEVKTQEMRIKELDKQIEQESRKENVIQINGEYQSLRKIRLKQGLDDLKTELVSGAQSQILGGEGNISDPDIALTVANQIAKNDLKLNDAYALLDEDKDGVLTIKEIQNNICRLNLNIKEQEIQEFIKMLDNNSDGVLTEQEFITFLTPGLENQKQYIQIMGDIKDILNPIILEERRLHLKYLQKYLQKEIEDENKKEREQKPRYDRLIKKLKKTEKLVESLKGTTSDKGKVKQQCDLLRQELRSIQDKRNRVIAELDDKKLMIKENIDQLMKDLGDRCQEVLQMKEKLNQVQTQSQRLQLKLLSIEQMKNKYKKELKIKNEIEISGGQKQNVLQQLRLKEEKIQQQEDVKNLQYMHYVIIVQKCTRGFLMKKRLTKKLFGLKGCARALVAFIEKKHRHQKMQGINLLEEFIKQQKKIEISRKEQELLKLQEQQKKKLKDKKANKVERFIAQQFVSTKVEDKLNNLDQTLSIIPKIILIQKIFRKNKRGIPLTNQAINVSFGLGYSENCQICKTDLAEVICKQCEKPIQCDSCFRLSHKNYKRRNHEFYLIIKNKFRDANEQLENRNIEKQNEMDEVLSNQ